MYAATIFLSAFLLFLVQPILAKQILPWFGGAAIVWMLCMVFFQLVLLLGYAYAHWLANGRRGRRQTWIHIALLAASLAFLPMAPDASWKPHGGDNPATHVLLLLFATVGLPYFLLSSTSPLVQSWLARSAPGASPYRLFALSNFASMLALLGYPFAVEPWLTNAQQSLGWSGLYVLFAGVCGALAWRSRDLPPASLEDPRIGDASREPAPRAGRIALWLALSATASAMLFAVTNHLTQNISSIPLLWVVPLAVYLLTFILCFESSRWYMPRIYVPALFVVLAAMDWMLVDWRYQFELLRQVVIFIAGLFFVCMFCHGELAARRPGPRHLTLFYLLVSLGGVLGGVLVGIVAPITLPTFLELEIALVAVALLVVAARWPRPSWVVAGLVAVFGTGWALVHRVSTFDEHTIRVERNYYGVLRVSEARAKIDGDAVTQRILRHGAILHGVQWLADKYRRVPTSYYKTTSGVGRTILAMKGRPIKVGVIGLGAGTIAAYAEPGDVYRFYDIDPAVIRIANSYFTFLKDARGKVDTVVGDGRLSLEREPAQGFDVLAIDAFSGDSIPVHLITVQAVDEYLRHMKPEGVIAFHVTNRFLDLKPVLLAIAERKKLAYAYVSELNPDGGISDWVLLTRNPAILREPGILESTKPVTPRPDWRVWTDDYNNLVKVFRY